MKVITIDIYEDTGEVKLETEGFIGKSCVEESQFIKDILGEEVHRDLKPVYNQKGGIVTKKHISLCG